MMDMAQETSPREGAEPYGPILLVEDNRGDALLIREMLRERGAGDVKHVSTVASAVATVCAVRPSCLVLDLWLPDAGGLEAVETVRAAAPLTPIVVLTGSDDDSLGARSLTCGAQDYLVKGQLTPRTLMRCIDQARERVRLEGELKRMALHDPLTGTCNRVLFLNRLEGAVARARRRALLAAVMMIDLDRFKEVNDLHGHAAGDEVLRVVSRRIQGSLRAGDTFGRLGGDEFAVLCEDVGGPEEIITVARRLLRVVEQPVTLEDGAVRVEGSVGIAFARAGQQPEALLRDADHAMYRAKREGHGRYQIFVPRRADERDG